MNNCECKSWATNGRDTLTHHRRCSKYEELEEAVEIIDKLSTYHYQSWEFVSTVKIAKQFIQENKK
jgi:hypothetical protein